MSETSNRARQSVLLDRLRSELGTQAVVQDPSAIAPYCTDWTGQHHGTAFAVLRPANTAHVAAIVRACVEAGVGIVPQGGNTSLVAGAIPAPTGEQVVLSLTRMRAIRHLDADGATITAEAGVVVADAQAAADRVGLALPLWLASQGSCTIGGVVSTNAGGIHVLRHGMTRDLVLGLEVVLPDGRTWYGLRRLRKDNTGYDLKQLFIGAEGTLGIITAAVLRLVPVDRRTTTVMVALTDPGAAVRLLGDLRSELGSALNCFELISQPALNLTLRHSATARSPIDTAHPWYALIEAGTADPDADLDTRLEAVVTSGMANGSVADAVSAPSPGQRQALWALREGISSAISSDGPSLRHDISLPLDVLQDFISSAHQATQRSLPGVRAIIFGHVGDGNLHYTLSAPEGSDGADRLLGAQRSLTSSIHDLVHQLGGSISAEHGLGLLKRDEATRLSSPVESDLRRMIKDALDPAGLLNPGKVL